MSEMLNTLVRSNRHVPVWFMRQNGRVLPRYRELRVSLGFHDMLHTPEIAAELTCLPVQELGVDAAMLFSDLWSLAGNMGFDVAYRRGQGPTIQNPIRNANHIRDYHDFDEAPYLADTIRIAAKELDETPVMGIAPGPFTMLSHLLGVDKYDRPILTMLYKSPGDFNALMRWISENILNYLRYQINAGVQMVQVFDNRVGCLSAEEYHRHVYPYMRDLFGSLAVPSAYYTHGSTHLLPQLDQLPLQVLSINDGVDLQHNEVLLNSTKVIQGNLNPAVLFADDLTIEREVEHVLQSAGQLSGFIFNVGRGLYPDTPLDTLRWVVKKVQSHHWRQHQENRHGNSSFNPSDSTKSTSLKRAY